MALVVSWQADVIEGLRLQHTKDLSKVVDMVLSHQVWCTYRNTDVHGPDNTFEAIKVLDPRQFSQISYAKIHSKHGFLVCAGCEAKEPADTETDGSFGVSQPSCISWATHQILCIVSRQSFRGLFSPCQVIPMARVSPPTLHTSFPSKNCCFSPSLALSNLTGLGYVKHAWWLLSVCTLNAPLSYPFVHPALSWA